MKSKPVYAVLELDRTARRHLFLTEGKAGLDAAQRTLDASFPADVALVILDDLSSREARMSEAMAEAGMETAFYIVGPEVFLWQTANRLRQAGVENRRIQLEVAGSAARRVYCVVCGEMNEQVTTTIHHCQHCGLKLTVREHFSRPLEAYMGVIADLGALPI